MFQYGQLGNLPLHVQHQHSDGSWGTMEPDVEHHDPAAHDPEQEWQRGHIFICRSCGERVRVEVSEDERPAS